MDLVHWTVSIKANWKLTQNNALILDLNNCSTADGCKNVFKTITSTRKRYWRFCL